MNRALQVLAVALCGFLFQGCTGGSLFMREPVPIREETLEVDVTNGDLFLYWDNPIDYEAIDVSIRWDKGSTPEFLEGIKTSKGRASAFRVDAPSGTHLLTIDAHVWPKSEGRPISLPPREFTVPPPFEGYLGRDALGLEEAEPLDIVYVLEVPEGQQPSEAYDFDLICRRMADNVLSEAFRSAVYLRGQQELLATEEHRIDSLRLTAPDALLVVDYRAPRAGLSAQLYVRVLDLRLCKDLDRVDLARDLYNSRPLVAEAFYEVPGMETATKAYDVQMALRDAWRGLLAELLARPIYRRYRSDLNQRTADADYLFGKADLNATQEASAFEQSLFFPR